MITNIFTWTQCFVLYLSVCIQHNPELIAELMAYMVSIVRESRKYSSLKWVQYDALFWKHAHSKCRYQIVGYKHIVMQDVSQEHRER